jgi:hypothetical protein
MQWYRQFSWMPFEQTSLATLTVISCRSSIPWRKQSGISALFHQVVVVSWHMLLLMLLLPSRCVNTINFLLLNKKFYIEVPQILCLKSSDQDCLVLIIQKQYLMSSSGIVLPPHFWLVLVLRDPWGLHQAWIGHLSFGFLSNGSFLHDYNQIVLLCFSMAAV